MFIQIEKNMNFKMTEMCENGSWMELWRNQIEEC